MLRVSIETEGGAGGLGGIADADSAAESPVPSAAALVAWVDATRQGRREDVAAARDRVRRELGSAAVVDAAAVMGNFERMVRIADGTGIPLDTPVNVATEEIRAQLGIDAFASAAHSGEVSGWQRALRRGLDPVVRLGLRWAGRRARRASPDS